MRKVNYFMIDNVKCTKKDVINLINRNATLIEQLTSSNHYTADLRNKLDQLMDYAEANDKKLEEVVKDKQFLKQENDICIDKIREIRGIADASIKTLRENEYTLRNQNQQLFDDLDDAKLIIELYTKLLHKLSEE